MLPSWPVGLTLLFRRGSLLLVVFLLFVVIEPDTYTTGSFCFTLDQQITHWFLVIFFSSAFNRFSSKEKKFGFVYFLCNLLQINILSIILPSKKFLFSSPFQHFSVYMRARARVREEFVRDWSAVGRGNYLEGREKLFEWLLRNRSSVLPARPRQRRVRFCFPSPL